MDNWLRVTIPEAVQFVGATYVGGVARPPDLIDGNVLTWDIDRLVADSTWGHILIELGTDEGLANGLELTTVAEIGGSAAETDTENNLASEVTTVIGPGPDPARPFKIYLTLVVR